MATTDPLPPEPRRFSIRLPRPLWIGVAAVVMAMLVIGLKIGLPIYREQTALREIQRLGGSIVMHPRGPAWFQRLVESERLNDLAGPTFMQVFSTVDFIRLPPDSLTWDHRFRGWYAGSRPYADPPTVDDVTLACITGVPGLRQLDLSCTNVSDVGMEYVSRLRNLDALYLDGTDVSDASGPLFARLAQLKTLSIVHSNVTAAGLFQLKALPMLEVLLVDDAQLTPAGMRQLAVFPSLKHVRVSCDPVYIRVFREEARSVLPSVVIDFK